VIILQTDVRADKETKVVEFMPLPSEPKVSLAAEGCFEGLQKMVHKHQLHYYGGYGGLRRGNGGSGEGVEVVSVAELGPHQVTVVKVAGADEFVQWVKAFFEEHDLGEPSLEVDIRLVVTDYLDRGFHYFAFDVVSPSPEKKTVQPIVYEFESGHFYYPLKVTNLYGGTGTVELFTILAKDHRIKGRPDVLSDICEVFAPRLPEGEARGLRVPGEMTTPVAISKPAADVGWEELKQVDASVAELMGEAGAFLLALRYEGKLTFEEDIWVEMIPAEPVVREGGQSKLAQRYGFDHWYDLAADGNTSIETLVVLARDRDPNVRWRVAQNRNAPPHVLTVLAYDDDLDVCVQVTRNPNAPEDLLWAMSQNKDLQVSLYAQLALAARGVDTKVRSRLSGILRKNVKALSPYKLELDGLSGTMWLRGDVLEKMPDGARIWVRGLIKSEKFDPGPEHGPTPFPIQWHIFMDVIECREVSSAFEEPRDEGR
jgi:hypothetical protein